MKVSVRIVVLLLVIVCSHAWSNPYGEREVIYQNYVPAQLTVDESGAFHIDSGDLEPYSYTILPVEEIYSYNRTYDLNASTHTPTPMAETPTPTSSASTPSPSPTTPSGSVTPTPTGPFIPPIPADCNLTYYFRDDFNGYLQLGWNIIRPSWPHFSLTQRTGNLRIWTETGGLLGRFNSAGNLFVRQAPTGWVVRTLLDFSPYGNFQQAGLLIYENDNSYITMMVAYSYGRTRLRIRYEGRLIWEAAPPFSTNPVYLSIAKAQTSYLLMHSADGLSWTTVATMNVPIANPQVGVAAFSDVGTTYGPADFEYFEIFSCASSMGPGPLPTPPPPTPTPTPTATCVIGYTFREDFNSTVLDPQWSWVRENPANWSLSALPGFLRIMTEYGGLNDMFNSAKNILLLPAHAGNYDITTKLHFIPNDNFHTAGLILYENDDSFIQMGKAYYVYVGGPTVEAKLEHAGILGYSYSANGVSPLYLRILKRGMDAYCHWSLDGINWNVFLNFDGLFQNHPQPGIFAYSDIATTSVNADFDYVQVDYCMTPTITPTETPIPTFTPICVDPPIVYGYDPPDGSQDVPVDKHLSFKLRDLNGGVDINSIVIQLNSAPVYFNVSPVGVDCPIDLNVIIPPQPHAQWPKGSFYKAVISDTGDCCNPPNIIDPTIWLFRIEHDTPTPFPTATLVPSETPTPTMTGSPTPTPTETPVREVPHLLLAGYWNTHLTQASGGVLNLYAFTKFARTTPQVNKGVELLFQGAPTGVYLNLIDSSILFDLFTFAGINVPAGAGSMALILELQAHDTHQGTDSKIWPFLEVQ